ncbi:mitogen-activated protein kinase kinase kinase 1 [Tanacetum coccineum]
MQPFTSSTESRLLHRSNNDFFILDVSTGNVYTVTLTTTPTCTCPNPTTPCKHILFLYIHVFSLPLNDSCLRRISLRPCQLTRMLSTQVSRVSLASVNIRQRFLEMYRNGKKVIKVVVEKGSTCPICLEEMESGGRRVVACATCKNPIHEMCLMMWKKRRSRTCVFCRARWKGIGDQDKYINLSAYVDEDENNYGVNVN